MPEGRQAVNRPYMIRADAFRLRVSIVRTKADWDIRKTVLLWHRPAIVK